MANSLFPRPNHISLHPKTCLCAHRRRKEEDDECEIGNSKKPLGFGSALPNLLPFLGRSPVRVSGQARGCFHEQGPPVGPPHGLSGGFRLRGQYLISESGGGLSGLMFSRQSQGLHILQEDTSFTRVAKMERSEFGIAIPANALLTSYESSGEKDFLNGVKELGIVDLFVKDCKELMLVEGLSGGLDLSGSAMCLETQDRDHSSFPHFMKSCRTTLETFKVSGQLLKWKVIPKVKLLHIPFNQHTRFDGHPQGVCTIKAWGATQEGGLEVCHTHESAVAILLCATGISRRNLFRECFSVTGAVGFGV
ncbi:hypothetical protein TIFTF001_014044 [Ficus carica]|uniref:Uncharacterized protein n=1 Tax=Ficus carica TaxID=3494 RepID=A0AA88D6M6_FICCA|nr:hypothetical protein TIFTF001_014044 [Ficus carica]